MRGDRRQRLPVGDSDDAFDRLARDVNALLDEIERLMSEVSCVGDAIAYDLCTPLTRLLAQLERNRKQARGVSEFREAVDQGLDWIDRTQPWSRPSCGSARSNAEAAAPGSPRSISG
ncbi:hypothetical protein [Methylobacterium haplocladii]|nr:hypothetical protein [Methylobacterium haplocladii]